MKIQFRIVAHAALWIVIGVICSNYAWAECHAKDLNFEQMMAVVAELNVSTSNLQALQALPGAATNNAILPVAIQITDRASVELSMFAGYIVIYNRLINAADRQFTEDFIKDGAGTKWKSAKEYADFLTRLATGLPQYGEEIRQARDRVRKIQNLFSCAADRQ